MEILEIRFTIEKMFNNNHNIECMCTYMAMYIQYYINSDQNL